ncbi:hypothetical protein Cgig2_006622 [Carnegiea gigantea]|uniref:Uncharacterized protein n=1 Tax=Carnegiea gigantea TaxID=171969 RepID=A0A9Q1GHI9_9CARY|nr:hypothetical protein Cgig2_006622 [Carnegiea gigantea]
METFLTTGCVGEVIYWRFLIIVFSVATMCGNPCERLLAKCTNIIVKSDVDVTTLDKYLAQHIKELGLTEPEYIEYPHNIQKGHTTLNDAYAFHYAVVHCDATAMRELLELGLPYINCRSQRVTYVCFQVISHYSLWMDLFSVGLAKLVDYSFLEAKITVDIAQMDGISEFTLSKNIDDA